ncbi:uncharacterized protein LOC108670596 [Hyalella azteca]|uniref:Uncharacterized protein LOC108670596 n=1 Tax=Hyalella azteca TaxID=294128 RepID=A0A8B7NIT2_HYAAZ|nr:uncharacterized protein LOC108670596 [Hyalella azteca]
MAGALLLVALLLRAAAAAQGPEVVCGQPGRPINGTVSGDQPGDALGFPLGGYPAGAQVSYACVEGFVLFGDLQRTCLVNGSWSGEVPLCDFNVGAGKRSLQSGTLWSYSPGLAVDGSPDTCSFTPRGPDPRWWQVHLGHKFNVIRVAVTISPGSLQEFTIYVIELLADNKALYKPCTTFKGVFKTHKAVFLCNDGVGHPGQFVYIRDDRKEEEYFGLCEVEVFAFRERTPCGAPGAPLHGSVTAVGGRAEYGCSRGFTLTGDSVHTCSSGGRWEGQEPRCVQVRCPDLPNPPNGNIDFLSPNSSVPTSDLVPGTVARYRCTGGFTVRGNQSRGCQHSGQWDGVEPVCARVSCGDPPEVPHARHTLLNTTSVHGGIAVYTCAPGYRLTNASADMVSTCEDSGKWRDVNITCELITTAHWELIENTDRGATNGRSLNYEIETTIRKKEITQIAPEQSSAFNSPLVMGLAVVAALLLIALLFLLSVFAVRRHYLTGPGSLNPLLRSPLKRPPTYDTGYLNNAAYIMERQYNDSMNNGNRTPASSLYHNNLLSVSSRIPVENGTGNADSGSLSGSINRLDEPPYERVRSRSEHSYETIRKLNQQKSYVDEDADSEDHCYQQEPNYERVSGDKGSLWYESADKASVGYETVPDDRRKTPADDANNYQIKESNNCNECKESLTTKNDCFIHKVKDPGYEKIKEKDHQYETLKEKDPGYETMKKNSIVHGYASIKPKSSGTNLAEDNKSDVSTISIPDILQGIEALEDTAASVPVPPEILALYAKVDKSKKKKKPPELSIQQNSEIEESNYTSIEESKEASPSLSIINAGRPTPPPRPKGMAPPVLQPYSISFPSSSPAPQESFSSSILPNAALLDSNQNSSTLTKSSPRSSGSHFPLQQTYSDSTIRISVPDASSRSSKMYNGYQHMASCDDISRPPSVASECTSPSGTLRPLPPIPKH